MKPTDAPVKTYLIVVIVEVLIVDALTVGLAMLVMYVKKSEIRNEVKL